MKTILLLILISCEITCLAQAMEQQNKEEGDYNFDSIPDYRIKSIDRSNMWDYYIFNPKLNSFDHDTLLSSLDWTTFDFEKKKFFGGKTIQILELISQTDIYEYINGIPTITERRICRQPFNSSERSDCDIHRLENGELIYKETMVGEE